MSTVEGRSEQALPSKTIQVMPPPCSPSCPWVRSQKLSRIFPGNEFRGFPADALDFLIFSINTGFQRGPGGGGGGRGPRPERKDSGDQCVRAARRGKERERERESERVRVRVIKGIGSGAWWSRLVRPERAAEASVRRRGEIGGPASLGLARSRCDGPHRNTQICVFRRYFWHPVLHLSEPRRLRL